MEHKYFFEPWVGKNYESGIRGKRILLVGASHDCRSHSKDDCRYYESCTDVSKKDSSPYNDKCPHYDGMLLSDTTKNEICDFLEGNSGNKTYPNFTDFMVNDMGLVSDERSLWDSVVFVNYIQFFLPKGRTDKEAISARDYEALQEIVFLYKPDIVMVWGKPVGDDLKIHKTEIRCDYNGVDENYLFYIDMNGQKVLFLNSYHPCCNYFNGDKENLKKQFGIALSVK